MERFESGEMRAHGGPGEQVDLEVRVYRPNVCKCGEQVRWRIVDVEASETVVRG
jgi:hypothetical protein